MNPPFAWAPIRHAEILSPRHRLPGRIRDPGGGGDCHAGLAMHRPAGRSLAHRLAGRLHRETLTAPLPMNAHAPEPRCYEFSFPRLDTAVEVETSSAGVVVRASRNSFSEERKACFIRELAAEGFIADEYRWLSSGGPGGVRWIVYPAQFMPGPACLAETRRLVQRMLFSATVLWIFLLGGLFLAAPR